MKIAITFCILCIALFKGTYLLAENPVTRYYKQIKVVTEDRKEQPGNGSGQFITFNHKGCYDSDKSGFTVNNGFLKFGATTDERVYYSGNSYWGAATYIFLENYNRLNIRVDESGITYVYVQTMPPANVTTCALIRKAETSPAQKNINPVNPINPPIDKIKIDKTPTSKQKYVTREENCHICHGNGKCSSCSGKGYVISTYTQKYANCVNCSNGKCSTCTGTGKITKGRYETVYE